MRIRGKFICFLLFICFMTACFSTYVFAEELPEADLYLEDLRGALPEEVTDILPEGDGENALKQLNETHLLSLSAELLKQALLNGMRSTVQVLAALLIISFAEHLDDTFGKNIGTPVSYLALLLVAYSLYDMLYSLHSTVTLYVERMEGFVTAYATAIGALTVMGGGTVQAATVGYSLLSTVALIGGVISFFLFPLIEISFVSGVTAAVSRRVNLLPLSDFLSSFFTYGMAFISMLTAVVMTFQTVLSGAEDSLSARSLRFAASSSIPIVGGAVGDSVRVLAASVGSVKKSVGVFGMVGLLILVLYPVAQLVSASVTIAVSKALSGALGVTVLDPILNHIQKCVRMMISVVVMVGILMLFTMGLYAFSTVPLEGAA